MQSGSRLQSILIGLLLVIAGGVIGYLASSFLPKPPIDINMNNDMFTAQSAYVQGVVTNVDGNKLTIKNTTNNKSDTYTAASNILINKFTDQGPASPSANLASIDLNKDATISFQLTDNGYQVIAISYMPPMPVINLPPSASSSGARR